MEVQRRSSTKSKEEVQVKETGKLGKRTVSAEDLVGMRGRFAISRDNVNQLDINNIGIGQRIWIWIADFFGAKDKGISSEQVKVFDVVKGYVEDLKDKRPDMLGDLNSIGDKLGRREYLDSDQAKELNKLILIEEQKGIGIEEAAEKTEAFYKFDLVIETKTKEAYQAFVTHLTKNLGLDEKKLAVVLEIVKDKVDSKGDFTDIEIKLIRKSIYEALVAKRVERENAERAESSEKERISLEKKLDGSSKELNVLKETNKLLNEKNAKLDKENATLHGDYLIEEERSRWFESRHNGLMEKVKKLEKANEEKETKLLEQEQQLKEVVESKELLNRQFKELMADKNGLQDQVQKLKGNLNTLESEIENQVTKSTQNLRKENEKLKQDVHNQKVQASLARSELDLLKAKTADYDQVKGELFSIKGVLESLDAKKEELRSLDVQLTGMEKEIEVNQKKGQELEEVVAARAQELDEMERKQTQLVDILKNEATRLLLIGQMMGAALPEEMKREYALNLGEEVEIDSLLSKEELTAEEVGKLKTWTYTLMQELEYENSLRKKVPETIGDLQGAFKEAVGGNKEERYLEGLKDRIKMEGYPDLITSDKDPRVFVFFVDGELLKITINSVDDIVALEEELEACRERAEAYKRFEEVEKGGKV